jgi:hypothetical protein
VTIWEFLARSEWPLVAIIALLLLRRPITNLFSRLNLTKIEAWGIKAEFERGLDKVEELAPPKEQPKSEEALRLRFENAASGMRYVDALLPFIYENVSPEAMVLDTWSRVEGDMRAMTDALHPRVGTVRPPPLRFQEAAREFGLTDEEVQSLMVLRDLRNKIAHSAERSLSWEHAARFKRSAEGLLSKMRAHWEELRKK